MQSSSTVSCVSLSFRTHPCVLAIILNMKYHTFAYDDMAENAFLKIILATLSAACTHQSLSFFRNSSLMCVCWVLSSAFCSTWKALSPLRTKCEQKRKTRSLTDGSCCKKVSQYIICTVSMRVRRIYPCISIDIYIHPHTNISLCKAVYFIPSRHDPDFML